MEHEQIQQDISIIKEMIEKYRISTSEGNKDNLNNEKIFRI